MIVDVSGKRDTMLQICTNHVPLLDPRDGAEMQMRIKLDTLFTTWIPLRACMA